MATPAAPQAAEAYANTRYPIALVPGLGPSILGSSEYWYRIPEDLRANGATVYVADVAAYSTDALRGEELVRQIGTVLALTGAAKVNLIGQSQGGLTIRYAAAMVPGQVASVTAIDTPHHGSPVADVLNQLPPFVKDVLASLANTTAPGEALGVLDQLSTSGAEAFNRAVPSDGLGAACQTGASEDIRSGNVQRLYSWTGRAGYTNLFDPYDPALALLQGAMYLGGAGDNDGVVPVCSAKFGQVLSTSYSWNHLDSINQLLGLIGWGAPDPVAVIRTHANRLKTAGL